MKENDFNTDKQNSKIFVRFSLCTNNFENVNKHQQARIFEKL